MMLGSGLRSLLLPAVAGLMGGCIPAHGGAGPDLHGACQMQACRCIESGLPAWSVGRPIAVQWRINGDAYCPAGYELRLAK
jgi:hypothetical protein